MRPNRRYFCAVLFLLMPVSGVLSAADDYTVFRSSEDSPREQVTRYLNAIGRDVLAARAREIAQIRTRADAERRKEVVREKVLRLIGGLPGQRGPLNTKSAGVLDRGDYRIEKIIFESLPGFYVPANIYVPASGSMPYPAVLMPVGHGDEGKTSAQRQIAIGFAKKGFIAMMYDPLGQGERSQYYDPDLHGSKVGSSTDEHSHANGHTMLIGENVARYRIWDGMRAIDYLFSRKDVDRDRIGCTGCSGGGALTTYISALDERVKVAAPACYITSWQELLAGPGPQDGEQVFPRFLSEGLDIADYVELFAPKPWLIASTMQDFFPLEGARQTYEEAKRIYHLYGAADRIDWFVGPGAHGVPAQSREALYAWFIKWLKNGNGDPGDVTGKLEPPEALLCTRTGQVSDSLGGESVFTLNKKKAWDVIPPRPTVSSAADVARLGARLQADIRSLASVAIQPGGNPPALKLHRTIYRDGYRLQVVSFGTDRGIEIPGLILIPEAAGPKPGILVVDSRPKQVNAALGGDLEDLAKSGYLVLAIQPRGFPETGPAAGRTSLLGDYFLAARAYVIGKTLVGMTVEDIIHSVDYLVSRPDVDKDRILGFGQGTAGVALLHAAMLDGRIRHIALQQVLTIYRLAVDHPVHRNLYDVGIPGVLRKYDLDDLLLALSPREVEIINPVDGVGRPVSPESFRGLCDSVFEVDRKMGQAGRVNVSFRASRESLHQFIGR